MLRNLFACLLAVIGNCSCNADNAVQRGFAKDLAEILLGDAEPIPIQADGGFRGVVLAAPGIVWQLDLNPEVAVSLGAKYPPGTSLSAIRFNHPVDVKAGVGNLQSSVSLDSTWNRLLSSSVPDADTVGDSSDSILFSKPDRVDRARGISKVRKPSDIYIDFIEYRDAAAFLAAQPADGIGWRLHPRFANSDSYETARAQLNLDWVRFGHRREVEVALKKFDSQAVTSGWDTWLKAKSAFDDNCLAVVSQVPLGLTYFEPHESFWGNMRRWITVSFKPVGLTNIVHVQITRVKIVRPWLDIGLVADKAIKVDWGDSLAVVSDGVRPSVDGFGQGILPNIIEELILVKGIANAGNDLDFPLARFMYPNEVNLVGYVVRTLPRIVSR